MKKIIALFLAAVVFSGALSGCGAPPPAAQPSASETPTSKTETAQPTEAKLPKVAILWCTMAAPSVQAGAKAADEAAASLGV